MSLNKQEITKLVHLARGRVLKVQAQSAIADQSTFKLALTDCPNASTLTTTAAAAALINRYFQEVAYNEAGGSRSRPQDSLPET